MYTISRTACTSDNHALGSYGSNIVNWVGYADNIVLVFENIAHLQTALVTLNDTFRSFSLQINVSKTKSMIFNFDKTEEEYPDVICNLEWVGLIMLRYSNTLDQTLNTMNRLLWRWRT